MKNNKMLKTVIKRFGEVFTFQKIKLFVFALFIFEALFFTFRVREGTSPDENYHLNYSVLHSNYISPFLEESLEKPLNAVSTSPFLYHYLMGQAIHLNVYHLPIILFLRLLNPILAIFTLIYLYKLSVLVIKDKKAALFSTFLLANTLMFTFISGFVSYDNLINLSAMAAIYYTILFMKKSETSSIIKTLIFLCIGVLTKVTFLPLAFGLFVVLLGALIVKRKSLKAILTNLKSKSNIALLGILMIAAGFTLYFFCRNFINYGSISPSCDQVLNYQTCYNSSGPYRRNSEFEKVASTLPEEKPIYTAIFAWSKAYTYSMYGTLTHRSVFFFRPSIVPFLAVFILGGFGILRNFKKIDKSILLLAGIAVYYTLVVYAYNYSEYAKYNRWIGMQGRYLFPVLGVYYVCAVYGMSFIKRINLKYALFIILAILVFLVQFLYFAIEFPDHYKMNWNKIDDSQNHYQQYLKK